MSLVYLRVQDHTIISIKNPPENAWILQFYPKIAIFVSFWFDLRFILGHLNCIIYIHVQWYFTSASDPHCHTPISTHYLWHISDKSRSEIEGRSIGHPQLFHSLPWPSITLWTFNDTTVSIKNSPNIWSLQFSSKITIVLWDFCVILGISFDISTVSYEVVEDINLLMPQILLDTKTFPLIISGTSATRSGATGGLTLYLFPWYSDCHEAAEDKAKIHFGFQGLPGLGQTI